MKKDPGIPNLFPFKDKILQEIEEKKRAKAEEQQRIRDEARQRKIEAKKSAAAANGEEIMAEDVSDDDEDLIDEDDDDMMEEDNDVNPMAALLASARARAAEYDGDDFEEEDDEEMDEDEDDDSDDGVALDTHDRSAPSTKETSRKNFDKAFKQVVAAADVILYVLDARDPEGTRSKEVEREVMAADGGSKRLILILNKVDLVPPPVLKAWMIHLRRYFPVLPLRASTGAPNAHTFNHKQLTVKSTSETLFKALKSYAGSKQLKRSISVGVIGYPNVGKSSVINALTSRVSRNAAACPTGAEAGVTTSLREVKLDNKLKLIDSPGIVFPGSTPAGAKQSKIDEQARLILLNAIPPKQIDDPIPAVTLLLKRLSASPSLSTKLLEVYGLQPLVPQENGDITTNFLVQVARKRGRLGKGGVPNLNSAAMTVVTDWRDGRIQGWATAPTLQVATEPVVVQTTKDGVPTSAPLATGKDTKEIVTEWAAEFKLDGLWGDGGNDDEMME